MARIVKGARGDGEVQVLVLTGKCFHSANCHCVRERGCASPTWT